MTADARRPPTSTMANTPPTWRMAVAVGLLSLTLRLLMWRVGLGLYENLPAHSPLMPARFPYAPTALRIWANWDGRWYLSIAHLGYQGRPLATAFFPAYPVLLSIAGGSVAAGLFIAWGAYLIGMVYLWRLAADRYGHTAAWYSIVGLAAFPDAFFFGAVYSESLYVALAAATLYYAGRRRYGWAVGTAAAASATSVYGTLLTPALIIAMLRDGASRRHWWSALLVAPAGLWAYMAFLTFRFGHPLLFDRVQSYWGRHPVPPWVGLEMAARAAWQSRWIITQAPWRPVSPAADHAINGLNFLVFLFILGIWAACAAGAPWEWRTYSTLGVLLPLLAPSRGEPLMSFPRLALMLIPLWASLGSRLARRPGLLIAYLALAGPLEIWCMARFVAFRWVA